MFYSGIILFFGVHLVPLNKNLKTIVRTRLGEGTYLGLFSFFSLTGILLIIIGYESSQNFLYSIHGKAFQYSKYFMVLSITLLIAANLPTYIKKYSKHPMSLGIALWSTLHLLTNSDLISVILFSSFLIYTVISVLVSEMRNVETNGAIPRIIFDIMAVILGTFLTILAYNFHYYLSGVNLV